MTEAIVLSETKFQDTSKILKLYTKEAGLVSVMAKGAMRPRSRLMSVSQNHVVLTAKLTEGRNFYYMDPVNIVTMNYGLRSDYRKMVLAGFLSELILKSQLERHPSEQLFLMLKKALGLMAEGGNPEVLALSFSIKYITLLGYMPPLHANAPPFQADLRAADIVMLKNLLYTSLDMDHDIDPNRALALLLSVVTYMKYQLDIPTFNSLTLL
ncbi:DNA repair protein RecO [Peptoniphilus equinus]|uniref:DNA repair protein RecO n=1 Tax=Peptoniphilus equinus TaxID=3016343 RepID=A0ABY7QWD3_9FIRM|nr:DNA repair protein RecO [Peptoniphilus equinus]WBW50380.1 DNA repair protein RecO [Peptoniphilus equinus]